MKYFYTDPLAATWMHRKFQMGFHIRKQGALQPKDKDFNYLSLTQEQMRKFGVSFVVRNECLYLLNPLQGDVIIGDYSGFEQIRFWDIADERKSFRKIIQRDGIAFMWPESEG